MLIFSHLRLLVHIAVANDAVSLECCCIGHYDQVIKIHQEAQEVEERLSEDLVGVVPFGSVEEVPDILYCLGLLL